MKKPGRIAATGLCLQFAGESAFGRWRQIDRGIFAAAIHLELELESVALVERRHAGALDRRNVHECIRLAIVALDEAKALHGVEELDHAARALARQLTLRPTIAAGAARCGRSATFGDRNHFTFDLKVGCRDTAATIDEAERKLLALAQAGETSLLDRRDVHEHILAAIVTDDEAEALLTIEEFDGALGFANDLGGHAATAAASATTEAATAAAVTTAAATAEAIAAAAVTAAAATAEAVAAATVTTAAAATEAVAAAVTAAEVATAEVVFAKAVALIPAAALPAPPTIETHAFKIFPNSPCHSIHGPPGGRLANLATKQVMPSQTRLL